MGLRYGWQTGAAITAVWYTDDAFAGPGCRLCGASDLKLAAPCEKAEKKDGPHDVVEDQRGARIPAGAFDAWAHGGFAAEHLTPYAAPGMTPDRIVYRPLSSDEASYVNGLHQESDGVPGFLRACLAAFRIAVTFPDAPSELLGDKAKQPIGVVGPYRGLAEPFVRALLNDRSALPLVRTLGAYVYNASRPTEPEKKASSPPSTPSRSLAATEPRSTRSEAPAAASDAATSIKTSTG